MLKPLTTEFKILGNGFETLKAIKKSYEDLKKSFRSGEKELSNGLKKVVSVLGKIKNGTVRVGNAFKTMGARSAEALTKLNKQGGLLSSTLSKIVALTGGGMLLNSAFKGATSLEMTRTAISSMRGETRANELMNFGVNFANVTPYQTNEVLDAVKKLEVRGLDPTKYLQGIGDMSAMLGKPLDQAVEAILDAVTGEFERLKEFGITKKMLEEQISVGSFDNKGSIKDQKKMFDDLMNYITTGYKGGMLKLSRTTTGLMSTVKGIYGSFTNLLFTGSETGFIEDESPLGVFKNKILQPLADDMIKWQQDGTFSNWSENFMDGFTKFSSAIGKVVGFVKKFKEVFKSLLGGVAAVKLAGWLVKITKALIAIFNPANKVILIISALGAIFTALYSNSETFREFVHNIGKGIAWLAKHTVGYIEWMIGGLKKAWEFMKGWKDLLGDAMSNFKMPDGTFKTSFEDDQYNSEIYNVDNTKNKNFTETKTMNETKNITLNINGGNTEEVRKTVEDVLFERDIRSGRI